MGMRVHVTVMILSYDRGKPEAPNDHSSQCSEWDFNLKQYCFQNVINITTIVLLIAMMIDLTVIFK